MTDLGTTRSCMTIGIDLGDCFSHLCVLDEAGETVEEGRFTMTPVVVRQRFEHAPKARIAIKAGTQSTWVSALFNELGHEVVVANPRKLRMIFKSDNKNDRVDAEMPRRRDSPTAACTAPAVWHVTPQGCPSRRGRRRPSEHPHLARPGASPRMDRSSPSPPHPTNRRLAATFNSEARETDCLSYLSRSFGLTLLAQPNTGSPCPRRQ